MIDKKCSHIKDPEENKKCRKKLWWGGKKEWNKEQPESTKK